MNDKGEDKDVIEEYATEKCELFSEVEAKGLELENGNCDVVAIKQSTLKELVNITGEYDLKEGEDFYRAKLVQVFVDDNGKEKTNTYPVLVAATSVRDAEHKIGEYMKQGLTDMRLDGIQKTKILAIV